MSFDKHFRQPSRARQKRNVMGVIQMDKEHIFDLLERYVQTERNVVEAEILEAQYWAMYDENVAAEHTLYEAIHSVFEAIYALSEQNAVMRHELKALRIIDAMVGRGAT